MSDRKKSGCINQLLTIALIFCAPMLQAANDYIVASSGGDITGAVLSAELSKSNVTLLSSRGKNPGSGNVIINDSVIWSADTTLTITGSNSVNINASISAAGNNAGLVINPNTANGNEKASGNGGYNFNAPAITLSGVTPSLTIGGVSYTVINSLGKAADATIPPSVPTLQGMAATANLSGRYALGSDIEAGVTNGWNSGKGFTPIGNGDSPFVGTFDGLGHSINNFTINRSTSYIKPATNNDLGLFGVNGSGFIGKGVIRNVGVSEGSVSGNLFIGGLVGENKGTISNSFATVSVTGGGYDVGGLVGSNSGRISNSYAMGSVTAMQVVGNGKASTSIGGLVGVSYGPISNSYATGNVTASGNMVGGLVGEAADYTTISNSYARGDVKGSNGVGGLVGDMSAQDKYSAATIEQSYATGNVSATGNAGGLVALMASDNSSGGGTVTGSYSVGKVYSDGSYGGAPHVGGLIGYVEPGSQVNNSYWDVTTSGQSGSGGGKGLTTGQMKSVVSLAGFDFTTAPGASGWVIIDTDDSLNNAGGAAGASYPMLASEYSTLIRNVHQFQLTVMAPDIGYSFDPDPLAEMKSVSSYDGTNISFTTTPGAEGWVVIDESGTLNNANGAVGATYPIKASNYSTTITDAYQLQLIAMDPAAAYTLAGGINAINTAVVGDVWGRSGFVPINNFSGSLDGQGNAVHNLTIARPKTDNVGLFGSTIEGAAIKNVGLIGGSVNGNNEVGGIVGYMNGGTVSNSFSITSVKGSGDNSGGLVGHVFANNSISASVNNSYAISSVSGADNVGGLVGQIQASGKGKASIKTSYSVGPVSATSGDAGGLVGSNSGGAVGGYWNTTTSGQSLSAGGAGLSDQEMFTAASFLGFDFKKPVWVIVDTDGSVNNANGAGGATYPMLAAEFSSSIGNVHQLQLMVMEPDAAYTLNADVDAAATSDDGDVWGQAGFVPVGGYSEPFSGSFDGQGYAISNLNINAHKVNRAGLFGVIGSEATVQDTILVGGSVYGYGSVGGLAGINNGVVKNCQTSVAIKSYKSSFVGGMLGSNNGTISNSHSSGNVSGTGGFKGGLVGINDGTINNCSASGTVSGQGGFSGPLVGKNSGTIHKN